MCGGGADERVEHHGGMGGSPFHIVAALTHKECIGGFLSAEKTHKGSIWRVEFTIWTFFIIIVGGL